MKRRLSCCPLIQYDAEGQEVGAGIQLLTESLFG